MNIQEIRENFKWFFKNTEYLLTVLIISVSLASFYLGRISVSQHMADYKPLSEDVESNFRGANIIQSKPNNLQNGEEGGLIDITDSEETKKYVASKSGTRYHLPWCAGAQQIKDSNKIYFTTKEDAENAGYTAAQNCKGI